VVLGRALSTVYQQLRKGESTVTPGTLVAALRAAFPRFAEQTAHGGYKQ
jgi:hypothetical protein